MTRLEIFSTVSSWCVFDLNFSSKLAKVPLKGTLPRFKFWSQTNRLNLSITPHWSYAFEVCQLASSVCHLKWFAKWIRQKLCSKCYILLKIYLAKICCSKNDTGISSLENERRKRIKVWVNLIYERFQKSWIDAEVRWLQSLRFITF